MKGPSRFILECLLTAVIMSASGQFPIDLPGIPVPITLQSMFAILLPLTFRTSSATLGIVVYLLLALLGLPVLAGGGSGLEAFSGNSGGFLIGFAVISAATHLWKERFPSPRLVILLGIFLFQHILLVVLGLSWIAVYKTSEIQWSTHVSPFIPGMLAKTVIGACTVAVYHRLRVRRGQQSPS
ncbi:MAG: biotin transporter BioY [Cryomorphaceae bacterium]